jgi:hypothetical protein
VRCVYGPVQTYIPARIYLSRLVLQLCYYCWLLCLPCGRDKAVVWCEARALAFKLGCIAFWSSGYRHAAAVWLPALWRICMDSVQLSSMNIQHCIELRSRCIHIAAASCLSLPRWGQQHLIQVCLAFGWYIASITRAWCTHAASK